MLILVSYLIKEYKIIILYFRDGKRAVYTRHKTIFGLQLDLKI